MVFKTQGWGQIQASMPTTENLEFLGRHHVDSLIICLSLTGLRKSHTYAFGKAAAHFAKQLPRYQSKHMSLPCGKACLQAGTNANLQTYNSVTATAGALPRLRLSTILQFLRKQSTAYSGAN